MGPSPLEQNLWERHNKNNDGDQENDDGWHVGYEVEMHGTGIEEYIDIGDNISETRWDSCSEDDVDRYDGYQTLPASDSSFYIESADCEQGSATVPEGFTELSSSESKSSGFEFDMAKSIELTEDKIEHIKKAMSNFTLPAPSWAKVIDSDTELKKLIEKLKSK